MNQSSSPEQGRILFVSNTTSKNEFINLQKMHRTQFVNASQIMFGSIISALSERQDISVEVVSIRPIRRADLNHHILFVKNKHYIEDNVSYSYNSQFLLPGFSIVWEYLMTLKSIISWCLRQYQKRSVIICDTLTLSSPAVLLIAKLFRQEVIAYITDIPSAVIETTDLKSNLKLRLLVKMLSYIDWSLRHYDKLIVVTKQMNKYVNPKNRPNIVVECIVQEKDSMKKCETLDKKVLVVGYFGKTNKRLGAELLIEASKLLRRTDVRFHIYGTGDYDKAIIESATCDNRMLYGGYISHDDAVQKERDCSLLVNLRPGNFEFTKTTFPSKLSEYMLSGVPVLTTHLVGIPKEYDPYLWYLEDESPVSAASMIDTILSLPIEERTAKGNAAREFMLANKNVSTQADRIVNFVFS